MSSPTEPSAALRQMASETRQIYIALTNEAFTEQQALIIIGQIILTAGGGTK